MRAFGGVNQMFVKHKSLDALKSNDSLSLGDVAVEGEWMPFPGLCLAIQAGYSGYSFSNTLFDSFDTKTRIDSLVLGSLVGYRFLDAIMPFVRAGFIASWTKLTISDGGPDPAGRDFAPGYYAMAGVELTVPRRWMRAGFKTSIFTVGTRIEAGYTDLGRFSFGGDRSSQSLIDRYRADLGRLELRGAALRIGFVISF